jgi:hypothetical protein
MGLLLSGDFLWQENLCFVMVQLVVFELMS